MKLILTFLAVTLIVPGVIQADPVVIALDRAEVLPLAIEDDFQFGKVKLFLNDPSAIPITGPVDRMISFESDYRDHGALTAHERAQRRGHYFNIWWTAKRTADITVRLEYRQSNLGPYVLAKEVKYTGVRGRQKTDFEVIGDEYTADGKITSWRAILIEDGKIVAMHPSFMWN